MTIAQNGNDVKRVYRASPVHSYVRQMVLKDKRRYMIVSETRYLALDVTQAGKKVAVTIDIHPSGIKVSVDYKRSQVFSLDALGQPDRILDYLGLEDDRNRVFAQMCAAFADAHRPQVDDNDGQDEPEQGPGPALFDLVIASKKYGYNTTSDAGAPIAWFKKAGEERQEGNGLSLASPGVQEALLKYDLVDTEARAGLVIRRYRKLDALAIARAAGATHQDTLRPDTFYKVQYPSGPVLQMSINGQVNDWQRSRYDYAPDWATAI